MHGVNMLTPALLAWKQRVWFGVGVSWGVRPKGKNFCKASP